MSKTVKRIYLVASKLGEGEEAGVLVRASSQAQAIGHVVRNRYSATVATQDQCIDLRDAGVKVETAGEES